MKIIRHRLDGDIDMVGRAIERIRFFEPNALQMHENGYYVAYSGGKDSAVIAELCRMAGVKFELVNNHTAVDPPELVYHVRREFERYRKMGISCFVSRPKLNMWQLIKHKGTPPSRTIRYCCDMLKEGGGKDRFVITGVRWAESVARRKRSGVVHAGAKDERGYYIYTNDNDEAQQMMRDCPTKSKRVLNPIIDWTDEEVWLFIKNQSVIKNNLLRVIVEWINKVFKKRMGRLPYCALYDEGFHRLGCIGCPMAGKRREKEFERWPTYKRAYLRAFGKMLEERERKGMKPFMNGIETAEDVMSWWMEETRTVKQIEGQTEVDL